MVRRKREGDEESDLFGARRGGDSSSSATAATLGGGQASGTPLSQSDSSATGDGENV